MCVFCALKLLLTKNSWSFLKITRTSFRFSNAVIFNSQFHVLFLKLHDLMWKWSCTWYRKNSSLDRLIYRLPALSHTKFRKSQSHINLQFQREPHNTRSISACTNIHIPCRVVWTTYLFLLFFFSRTFSSRRLANSALRYLSRPIEKYSNVFFVLLKIKLKYIRIPAIFWICEKKRDMECSPVKEVREFKKS